MRYRPVFIPGGPIQSIVAQYDHMQQTGQTGSITWRIESYRRLARRRVPDGWGILLGEGVMIMEKFIHDENLKLFRKRLVEATNETQRQLILFLIKEEEAKTPAILLSKIKGPD